MGQRLFLLRRHFAEGACVAVGDEDRVVTEAMLAARRKRQSSIDAAFDGLAVTVRPAERERADEIGRRANGLDARAPPTPSRYGPSPRENPSPAPPSGRNRCRARRRAPSTTRPESSASAGSPLAWAAARALSAALAMKVSPVSSGSARPSADAPTASMPRGSEQRRNLADLARVMARDDQTRRRETTGHTRLARPGEGVPLQSEELLGA